LLGNVKDTLDAVLASIKEKTDPSHLSEALRDYKTRLDLDALAESSPHSDIIHPQYPRKHRPRLRPRIGWPPIWRFSHSIGTIFVLVS